MGINLSNYFTFSSVVFAIYVYTLGYSGFLKSEIFEQPETAQSIEQIPTMSYHYRLEKNTDDATPGGKYEKSGLNREKAEEYLQNLKTIMEEKNCFWSCLFDLSFTEFITTRVIKILYMLGIAIAAIVGLILIVTAFTKGFAVGLLHVIAAPIVFILMVIVLRIYMELVLTLFRIEENTRKPAPAEEDKPGE